MSQSLSASDLLCPNCNSHMNHEIESDAWMCGSCQQGFDGDQLLDDLLQTGVTISTLQAAQAIMEYVENCSKVGLVDAYTAIFHRQAAFDTESGKIVIKNIVKSEESD